MPEGFEKVAKAEVCINPQTGEVVVFGDLDDSDEAMACEDRGHSCDQMECGSVSAHVVAVAKVLYPQELCGDEE